jgi:hypothetical protein
MLINLGFRRYLQLPSKAIAGAPSLWERYPEKVRVERGRIPWGASRLEWKRQ